MLLQKIKNQEVVISRVTSPFIAGPAWRAITKTIRKFKAVEKIRAKKVVRINLYTNQIVGQIKNLSNIF